MYVCIHIHIYVPKSCFKHPWPSCPAHATHTYAHTHMCTRMDYSLQHNRAVNLSHAVHADFKGHDEITVATVCLDENFQPYACNDEHAWPPEVPTHMRIATFLFFLPGFKSDKIVNLTSKLPSDSSRTIEYFSQRLINDLQSCIMHPCIACLYVEGDIHAQTSQIVQLTVYSWDVVPVPQTLCTRIRFAAEKQSQSSTSESDVSASLYPKKNK
jgi:hypothetical protein